MRQELVQTLKREFKELVCLREGKIRKIVIYAFAIALLIIYLVAYYAFDMEKTDTLVYMNGVRAYFELGNPYVQGFIYLDYFCYLFVMFLLPFWAIIPIRITTNLFVGLLFFQIQSKNKNNINLVWWIYANYYTIYNDILQLNFNSIIPLIFYIYYTYREDYPWTSLLLLFCMFKVTSIPLLIAVIILDILFKRGWHKIKRDFMYLIPVILIVGISLITSIRLGFLESQNSVGDPVGLTMEILGQPWHFFMYSFLLYVLIDKFLERQKDTNKQYKIMLQDNDVKKIWKIYFALLLILIIVDTIIDYSNMF